MNFLNFWNPARYPTVEMTDVGQAYDLMSQLGALLKTQSSSENPLVGFDVERIIGTGYSQSGSYLITYANEFGDDAHLPDGRQAFDGYLIAGAGASAKQINTLDEDNGVSYTDDGVSSRLRRRSFACRRRPRSSSSDPGSRDSPIRTAIGCMRWRGRPRRPTLERAAVRHCLGS